MGRKISNILKGEIVSSIFYIALGLCLLLIPDQTVNIICKVIFGLIMIAAGVYHVGIYVAEKEKSTILDLFTGVITMVLGVFLFFTPQIVIKILPYLLGAFVLVDSFWKLKGTHRLRKAELGMWKIFLIGSLIFILLGIAVMFYPFISVTKMILFCGCILTVTGAVDLVFLIMLKVGLRKAEKRRQQEKEKEEEKTETEKKEAAVVINDTIEQNTAENGRAKKKISLKKRKKAENAEENTGSDSTDVNGTMPNSTDANSADSNNIASNHAVSNCADTELTDNESNVIEEDSKLPEKTADVSSEFPPKFATGDLELETEKTAEAADADSILKPRDKWSEDTAEMESPNREIQEMLKNHEEPLEEWKD